MGLSDLRNTVVRCGGIGSYFSMWIRSSFRPFWTLLQNIPGFSHYLNQFYLSAMLSKFVKTVPRIPHHTLRHDYPTMDVLYDESRTTYSRLLPRNPAYTASLPDVELAVTVFNRDEFIPETNRNLTVLISYYAQWFTHQFFNTNSTNPTDCNMPVGINLSMLYGSTKEMENNVRAHSGGLLKSTYRHGLEFPEIIPTSAESRVPGEEMFNIPIPLANILPGFAAVHVLFFRRHNHICRELAKWAAQQGRVMDDEEIFQKAKMIVAFNVLRITMHDYVANALQSSHVKIRLDQQVKKSTVWKFFGPKNYHPCNAIQVEFNFLYRWHQFLPDEVKVIKKLPLGNEKKMEQLEPNTDAYETETLKFPPLGERLGANWNAVDWLVNDPHGLERVLFSAASQRAGKLQLMNSNRWLVQNVIKPGMAKCREYELASYNDYREHFGFGRVTSFEQITADPVVQNKLKSVYGHVDKIEYYPGVFAEDKEFGGVHGPFLSTIGVGMTYSGIFASRLFEADIINEEALTPRGMELANEIEYFRELTKLHSRLGNARMRFTTPEGAPLPNKKNQ